MTIVVQPSKCTLSGERFDQSNPLFMLKCGCALGTRTVRNVKAMNDSGFVLCPVCDYSYTLKNPGDMVNNNTLTQEHVLAQLARCKWYEKEIDGLQKRLDVLGVVVATESPEMNEDEATFLEESDDSVVDDSSEDELADFTAFESTSYWVLMRRLAKLKEFKTTLEQRMKETLELGKRMGGPRDWASQEVSLESADADRVKRRQTRRAERLAAVKERQKQKGSRSGANQVVHNVYVLNKQAPRKWVRDNPNAPKPADWEEKERDKQGWLTAKETEEMDEEEQEKLKAARKAEWKSQQSKVPKMHGSIAKQRWGERLYRQARRRHYIDAKIAGLKETAGSEQQVVLWKTRLETFEARLLLTQTKCNARVEKMRARDRMQGETLETYFADAVRIGIEEIEAEVEAKRKAAEEARLKAEAEAEAQAKAEAKAKAKADAEARGETWVDPDADANAEEEEE
jgi:hypothetical protein